MSELASRADVSKAVISELERGKANPSLMTMMKLTRALGVPFDVFFSGAVEEEPGPGIVRADERRHLTLGLRDIQYELLTPNLQGRVAVYLTTIPPGWSNFDAPLQHEGEEFNLILEGEAVHLINGREYRLRAGDSMVFDSSMPHAASNPGKTPLVTIAMQSPPAI